MMDYQKRDVSILSNLNGWVRRGSLRRSDALIERAISDFLRCQLRSVALTAHQPVAVDNEQPGLETNRAEICRGRHGWIQ